ncbi:MAG: phage integrase N-terminal SAM-like domain-containing protein [Hyphomicrobiales bacterium]|nr:phage integrase N-terminal SAM-like domain-containing protein [Hyphomicrobiales bacterium]
MLRKGISIFAAPCDLNELRVAEIPQVLQRVSSQSRLDRIGQPILARISTHPGNGTLLGADRRDDQRISKSRFDATAIVRVAAFDRTLPQLDFGSIASKASAEDLRRYQLRLATQHTSPATINQACSALRFFFKITLDGPYLTRHLTRLKAGFLGRKPRRGVVAVPYAAPVLP